MSGQITALQDLLRNNDYLQVNEIDIPQNLSLSLPTQQLLNQMIGPQVPLLRLKDPYFNLKARVQDFKEVYQNFESYKSTRVRSVL